ncbi:MAG TPA: phosphatidylglycerol lysyltransferase domain-containing protein [Candidatus Ozemobacteraceae bacterium]|nr:phosphatidylglycerol lysyltransferase domain-containing protein [Candidatus Ozemobacteraceae bacterium]HQG28495.1 phosphatidylglycerol lysyltransferase domain-containing protein [Candidatus Ozemobacteraceae bacterium]
MDFQSLPSEAACAGDSPTPDLSALPEFPHQTPLTFSHKFLVRRLLEDAGVSSSDYALYNLLGWYKTLPPMASRIGSLLSLAVEGPRDRYLFLAPVGKGPLRPAVDRLMEYMSGAGLPCELRYVPKSIAKEIAAEFPDARVEAQRDDFDYLYDRKELAELSGRRFHQKKNFVNRLEEEEKPQVEIFTPSCAAEVTAFLDEWYKGFQVDDENVRIEASAIRRMLPQLEKICAIALVARVGGRLAGFTVASPIHRNCWVVTLEKADRHVKGLYQYLNWALANRLPAEVTVINRETDLGIEGLRTAKLSYHPIGFEEKFTIRCGKHA